MSMKYTYTIKHTDCPVGKCDGSGWLPVEEGTAVSCECQKVYAEMAQHIKDNLSEYLDAAVRSGHVSMDGTVFAPDAVITINPNLTIRHVG